MGPISDSTLLQEAISFWLSIKIQGLAAHILVTALFSVYFLTCNWSACYELDYSGIYTQLYFSTAKVNFPSASDSSLDCTFLAKNLAGIASNARIVPLLGVCFLGPEVFFSLCRCLHWPTLFSCSLQLAPYLLSSVLKCFFIYLSNGYLLNGCFQKGILRKSCS